jgi:hypothetical protein
MTKTEIDTAKLNDSRTQEAFSTVRKHFRPSTAWSAPSFSAPLP